MEFGLIVTINAHFNRTVLIDTDNDHYSCFLKSVIVGFFFFKYNLI